MEKKLVNIVDLYDEDEEQLYEKSYLFLKGMAVGCHYNNVLKALPLAKKFHYGQYRKGTIVKNGKEVRLPYLVHTIEVCSILASLNIPMTNEELDILYASALLHDCLEDAEAFFPKGGIELVQDYGMPQQVLDIVTLLTKYSGADEYELNAYFNNIKYNKYALLIKLADRSHNVEDLYNMKLPRIHKYIAETQDYILPLIKYAKQSYPELSNVVVVLKDKIKSLTRQAQIFADMLEQTQDRCEKLEQQKVQMQEVINTLKEKSEQLERQVFDLEVQSGKRMGVATKAPKKERR